MERWIHPDVTDQVKMVTSLSPNESGRGQHRDTMHNPWSYPTMYSSMVVAGRFAEETPQFHTFSRRGYVT